MNLTKTFIGLNYSTNSMDDENEQKDQEFGNLKWKEFHKEYTKGKENFKFKPKHVSIESVVETMLKEEEEAFEKPVPLNDLVEILNEMWETDGLYD